MANGTHHAVKVLSFTFQSLLVCDNDTICAKNGGQQWQTFKCLPCRCKKEVFVPDQVINVLFLVWQSQGDGWTCHPQNTPHCKNQKQARMKKYSSRVSPPGLSGKIFLFVYRKITLLANLTKIIKSDKMKFSLIQSWTPHQIFRVACFFLQRLFLVVVLCCVAGTLTKTFLLIPLIESKTLLYFHAQICIQHTYTTKPQENVCSQKLI